MNLRSLTVRSRLTVAFGALTLGFAALVGVQLFQNHQQAQTLIQLRQDSVRNQATALAWDSAVRQNLLRTRAVLTTTDQALATQLSADMKTTSARIDELQKSLEAVLDEANEREAFLAAGKARSAYTSLRKEALAARAAGDEARAKDLVDAKVMPALNAYLDGTQAVLNVILTNDAHAADDAMAQIARREQLNIAVTLAFLVAASVLAWRIGQSVNGPLARVSRAVDSLAEGDLRIQLDDASRDEVGVLARRLQAAVTSVGTVLRGVQQSSDSVMTASREIAAGNQDLSARTEAQASSLQESAAAVEELTATVQNNAQSGEQASSLAGQASDVTVSATQSMTTLQDVMQRIHTSSVKVGEIVSIIDGIAFQTNILALNAAVEAARAGEQGRGFAVVAGEVRALAQRSAESAREIKAVVHATLEQVSAGVTETRRANETMQDASEKVAQVRAFVEEIASATQQQASGLHQINQAIAALDNSTQQNSALVEESAAAAQSLSEQALQLSAMANRFQVA
jgi:methyl-accepting chemotaxis protein